MAGARRSALRRSTSSPGTEPRPTPAEPPAPLDGSAASVDECRRVRKWIADSAARSGATRAADRAHIAECEGCRDAYAAVMSLAAGTARAHRARIRRSAPAVPGHPTASPTGRPSAHPAGHATGRPSGRRRPRGLAALGARGKHAWLRALLIPAFAMFLMVRGVSLLTAQQAGELDVVRGHAEVGGALLVAASPDRVLRRGDAWIVGEASLARASFPGASLELGARSEGIVEDPRELRIRLWGGPALLGGTGSIATPWGVVEVADGEARVRADRDGVDVEALAGEVVVSNALGRRRLVAGDAVRLDDRRP